MQVEKKSITILVIRDILELSYFVIKIENHSKTSTHIEIDISNNQFFTHLLLSVLIANYSI